MGGLRVVGRLDSWLKRLGADPRERRNALWRIASGVMASAGGVFRGGPVFQSFLVHAGLSAAQIGLHGSVGSAAGTVGTLLLMGVADRLRLRVRAFVLCGLASCVDPIVLLALALLGRGDGLSPTVVLAAIVAVAAVLQTVASLHSMVYAGLIVRLFRQGNLGRVHGASGVLSGAAAIAFGLLVARVLATADAPGGFAVCFAAAVPLLVVAALVNGKLVELPELASSHGTGATPLVPWSAIRTVFRLPQFRDLLVPNLLRGLLSGVELFAWVVGLKSLDMPAAYIGLAATVQAVSGSILGSAVIGLCSDRWGPGPVVFGGSLLSGGSLAAMVLTRSPEWFLAFFGLLTLGASLVALGVPLGTYRIVPPDLLGAYSGFRRMLVSAAGAVSMPLVGVLLESVGAVPVFVAGSAVSLLMGIGYWRGFHRHRRLATHQL